MSSSNFFLIDTYKKIKNKLPDYVLKSIVKLLPFYLISSIFEILGLVILFPIIKIIIEPSYIQKNKYILVLYDSLHFKNNITFVLFLFCSITLIFIFKNFIILLITKKQTKIAFGLASRLSLEKYNSYLNRPYSFHSENNTAVLLRNFTQMPFELILYGIMPFIAILSELFILLLIISAITIYDPILFWSLIAFTAPFLYFYTKTYKKKLKNISDKRDTESSYMYKLGLQSMEAFREMIVFNKKDYFKPIYKKTVDSFSKSLSDIYTINSFSPKIVETVAILSIFTIFISGYFLNKDINTMAQFLIVFTIAAYRVIPSMNKIILSSNYIKSSAYIFEYFDKSDDSSKTEPLKFSSVKIGDIEFKDKIEIRDLSFSFQNTNKNVINKLNLSIKKGQTIGIIGTSGAGKSTLLNILLRLYEETTGGIYIDDTKIEKINLQSWYKLVSYVPQNITLMDASIIENIAFGIVKEEIDFDLLQKVVIQSQLENFIDNLPKGLHTEIGEKGIKISGGQRQRIGIARALYHGGSILIFDEATSSLDNETEEMLTESINNLSHKDLTIIIVAHRVQTLKFCDAIYKLEQGEIISGPKTFNEIKTI